MKKRVWVPFALTAALLLAACNSDEESAKVVETEQSTDIVTIENEGITIVSEQAPTKAVTVNQHATEVMLALGLEDSMVGTAYLDDVIYEPLQEAYNQVPVLSETSPSKEQIIAVEADFIYGGWASFFDEKKFGSREQLQALEIDTYVQSSSMKIAPTVEDVYTDIRNIAKIFRVEQRGEQLISQINRDIDAVTAKIPNMEKPLDVLVYDSGETEVYTAAQSFLNTLITMAGAKNIFGDIEDTWTTVSKEDAIERSPEVIVVTDYGSTTAEEKIHFLKTDPALSQTSAVQNERFVVLPLTAAAEGVRIAHALEILVKGFYPEAF